MRNSNNNMVKGHLSENYYLMQKFHSWFTLWHAYSYDKATGISAVLIIYIVYMYILFAMHPTSRHELDLVWCCPPSSPRPHSNSGQYQSRHGESRAKSEGAGVGGCWNGGGWVVNVWEGWWMCWLVCQLQPIFFMETFCQVIISSSPGGCSWGSEVISPS